MLWRVHPDQRMDWQIIMITMLGMYDVSYLVLVLKGRNPIDVEGFIAFRLCWLDHHE